MHAQQPPLSTTLLIYAVAIAIFVWRMSRPQRTTVFGLWFRPVLLLLITAFVVYSGTFAQIMLGQMPAPPWEIGGVMYVHSSPAIVIVWLVAFLGRAALRLLLPGAQGSANVIGDGLLAFAVAALITSCFMIYTKYRGLTQQPQPV